MRGGFPRSYLSNTEENNVVWREGFTRTLLENNFTELGKSIPPGAMRHFWAILAHYHRQIWNGSELGPWG